MKPHHRTRPAKLSGSIRDVKRPPRKPVTLPEGLWLVQGRPMYECASCGQDSEWHGELDEFRLGDPVNVCGRSPRCCP